MPARRGSPSVVYAISELGRAALRRLDAAEAGSDREYWHEAGD